MPLKSDAEFAEEILRDRRRLITATSKVWEHLTRVDPDEIQPAFLPSLVGGASANLLHHSTEHGVALDWTTARWHLHAGGPTPQAILRVDVL